MDNEVLIKDDIVIGRAGERDLKADLFLPPESTSNSKAIVIVHGGGWREGSKEQLRGYGILLSREGFVCLCALNIDSLKKKNGQHKSKTLSVRLDI